MAGFKRFEEINAWQKSRYVTKMIYELTSGGVFAKDFGLRDQIRRSDKEFANFLNIAHGSAAETQSHLYIASDLEYLNRDNF